MPNSRNDQRDSSQGNERQPGKSNRGFAAMNKEEQREITRKGGEAVSRNREHMAQLGRRGGEASGANRSRTSQSSNMSSSNSNSGGMGSDANSGENR